MKLKYLFITALLAIINQVTFGQHKATGPDRQLRKERMEKIQSAKIAYITEKLQLTPEQSQKFWPVYNQYEGERRKAHAGGRDIRTANLETMTDQQVRAEINEMYANRQNELNIEKQYVDKFLKVISVKQLATLYRSEREFSRELLKKLDNHRSDSFSHR